MTCMFFVSDMTLESSCVWDTLFNAHSLRVHICLNPPEINMQCGKDRVENYLIGTSCIIDDHLSVFSYIDSPPF